MEETENITLEINDIIGYTYHGKPKSLNKIIRVTPTQAIDEKGNKFRRQLINGNVRLIGAATWFSEFSFLSGDELANFTNILNREKTIIRIVNISRGLAASNYENAAIEDLETLYSYMRKIQGVI